MNEEKPEVEIGMVVVDGYVDGFVDVGDSALKNASLAIIAIIVKA